MHRCWTSVLLRSLQRQTSSLSVALMWNLTTECKTMWTDWETRFRLMWSFEPEMDRSLQMGEIRRQTQWIPMWLILCNKEWQKVSRKEDVLVLLHVTGPHLCTCSDKSCSWLNFWKAKWPFADVGSWNMFQKGERVLLPNMKSHLVLME